MTPQKVADLLRRTVLLRFSWRSFTGFQTESPTAKENSNSSVFKDTEATGQGFDRLNPAVESFSDSVTDWRSKPRLNFVQGGFSATVRPCGWDRAGCGRSRRLVPCRAGRESLRIVCPTWFSVFGFQFSVFGFAVCADLLGRKLGHPIIFPDHGWSSRLPGSFDDPLRNSLESGFDPGRQRAVCVDWFSHKLTPRPHFEFA